MDQLTVDGAVIEFGVAGSGEPILLIDPSVITDGLARPLLHRPELADRYRLIHYRRRGYGASTLPEPLVSVADQAADAAALLTHVGERPVHVVGHSLGAVIAVQLAIDAHDLVHSLALLEPALLTVPGAREQFERNVAPALAHLRSQNTQAAVDCFLGKGWQPLVERFVRGATEQAMRDARTFFESELPALVDWKLAPQDVAKISQPVLSVVGEHSPAHRHAGRRQLHAWFAQTDDLDLAGATHLLQMQRPQDIAAGLHDFFARHPIGR